MWPRGEIEVDLTLHHDVDRDTNSRGLDVLKWRNIGPHRGGRVVAVAGDPKEPMVFYFGACAGGVWKTTDGGTYWQNVSDGFFKTAAVGAIAVAESDPNVIYVGMGEACIRGNVSHGDGVYKSSDGGKTWEHLGLEDTRHISRIRVHPQDPDCVYVAALGHAFGPNRERGIFRSRDGGKTWSHVLFKNEQSGAADLSMDPNNPRILYAALWEVQRSPWSLTSGGLGSSIYKSTDSGESWTDITNSPGLPTGIKGRIGLAVSPARTDRIWALVEAADGALFRSDNGGASWIRLSEEKGLRARAWYYSHIFADPKDAETLYILNVRAFKSLDGGRSFIQFATPHGDNHDLWIDPSNPQRMIEGNDGGACVSFNGGATWSTIYNQPTAQFYHVAVDTQYPYRVYGTQQDNTAISVPSQSHKGAIQWNDCYTVGSSESGHIAVRPDNPNIVYSGAIGSAPGGGGVLLRYDHATGQVRIITVWPEMYYGWGAKDAKYRFQWTFPIVISPHDPKILYAAANIAFRSIDEGTNWEPISPDLTRNDVTKMEPSGGPITKDTTGAEFYCTIFAFVESPHERGVFWAGTDDGLVHISMNDGKTWEDVTPPDLPEWTTISSIEPSPHDPAKVYVTASRYKLDDLNPYVYKTTDYGKSWQIITNGIPVDGSTRVLREDPKREGLLFVGTELGVFVSFDDGGSWKPIQNNLPVVPIYDLIIYNDDLVAATHGRSFWILDDLTVLHQLQDHSDIKTNQLYKPRTTTRLLAPLSGPRQTAPGKNYLLAPGVAATFYDVQNPDGGSTRIFLDAGTNPPGGVRVTYYLEDASTEEYVLKFLDSAGKTLRSFSSLPPKGNQRSPARGPQLSTKAGFHQFVWDMRCDGARPVPGDVLTEGILAGPLVPPGHYQVQLSSSQQTLTESFDIAKDPRTNATQEDLEAQYALLVLLRETISKTHDAVNRIRSIKSQLQGWVTRTRSDDRVSGAISDAASQLDDKLSIIEEELIQTKANAPEDRVNLPTRLNAKLTGLVSAVAGAADAPPPRQCQEVYDLLSSQSNQQIRALKNIEDDDLAAFNNLIQELELPGILPTVTT